MKNKVALVMGGGAVGSPGNYRVGSVGDYNGDGRADMLLRHSTTGEVGIWFMNGSTISGGGAVGSPGADFQVY